jgi:succinoglycan biosynthesis protein ExoA
VRVAYLLSRYPTLSETFIAREMQQLADLGHEITICQLKWPGPAEHGLRVSPARDLRPQFGLWSWAKGLTWVSRYRPDELKHIWGEYRHAGGDANSRLKLLTILLTTLRLAQCLDGAGIEHVRAHFLHSEAVGAMWLARLLRISHSITAQMATFHFSRAIIEQSVRTASFCAATTNETFTLLSTWRGTEQGVHLVRSGLDLQTFETDPVPGRKPQPPLILGVGRLVETKGFDLLIRACALLREWGVDFRCEIIGDGPQHTTLNWLITQLDLSQHASLVGALSFDEVKHYYRRASVLVMPSRDALHRQDRDGLPNVIIEALAMRVPVIASALAGIPDLVIPDETGLLVPVEDVMDLAVSIRRVLMDDDLRTRLGWAGHEKVEEEFDLTKTTRTLESLIRGCVQPQMKSEPLQDGQPKPFVTVIMPVRNEGDFITRSLGAVLAQDYPPGRMEVIVADGMSTDCTREIVRSLQSQHPQLSLIDNVGLTAPAALNRAQCQARGELIIRVDGHCVIKPDYVRRCVDYLARDGIDVVGGPLETVGETAVAQVIAIAMSSRFGVGGSAFRTTRHKTMLTDTVPFPAYTRAILERGGPYDEEIPPNEDDEYNYRLGKMGAKILLAKDVQARYYCRGSLRSLWRQYFRYGHWKVRVFQKHPRRMRPRHFVPLAFVTALIGTVGLACFLPLGRVLLTLLVATYLTANLGASLWTAHNKGWRHLPLLPAAFATLHFSYGIGFLTGLVRFWNRWGDTYVCIQRSRMITAGGDIESG